ncbi:MAG TPA: protease [Thermoanaerobaculia bacterium]|nr:protease [Thermoanaerobaculia bacterium]
MPKRLILAAAMAALFLASCMRTAEPTAAAPRLECRLEASGPSAVRFTLVNRTDAPLWALRWNTPLEGWRGTIFELASGGAEIPYTGPMTKRGDPGREDYVEIPAGGKVEGTVDLTLVYDLGKPGTYRLRVTGGLQDLTTDFGAVPRPRDRHEPAPLDCPAIEIRVGG